LWQRYLDKDPVENSYLIVKIAEAAGKDIKIQRDLNSLAEQLRLGNKSPGIGIKALFKGVKEAHARAELGYISEKKRKD